METVIPYEQRLKANPRWALLEGSMHFEKESKVYASLLRITKRLDDLGVPYALVGGMAMFLHGYRRFTDDVNLLVTADGLKRIHERLEGLGYVPPFTGSKQLRDTENGVRIEFLVTGAYPGDGKPKPVSFPDPATVFTVIDEIKVLNIVTLVQLKLASGTAPGRLKDLGDVQELIRVLELGEELAEQLDPSVREQYLKLWRELRELPSE
ncbi:nucleotidyltransferase family protein [Gemmata sp. JC717]|uniref:nucleotidyltransferase family protein n=1 Tax=Gemmata algarum TaxID=2975278 RepID=UPI0021BA8271|nr:nucleotidyltransferase family protein [Gemmata algarum]MDY3556973.1 nucleotidyltransferase family protein [Gemmata algarum]